MNGASRIFEERKRQISEEGYTSEHDDKHVDGQLALVAALYAAPVLFRIERPGRILATEPWPDGWGPNHDKRPRDAHGHLIPGQFVPDDDRINILVKAGALCAAEIDRLERKKLKDAQPEDVAADDGEGCYKEGM